MTTTHATAGSTATTAASRSDAVTVASVPSGHVYVRHLTDDRGTGVRRLPDPDPASPHRPTSQRWWPPAMLESAWAADAEFDLFHLHFGFDARTPDQLAELVATLRRRGKPFAFTVHDLRNPHHPDRAAHDAQLDVLVPAADALLTLTPGAAGEIARRWGRTARVAPHPHVVPLPTMAQALRVRPARRHDQFRVGLHLKSLRPSMDPMRILPTLLETVSGLPDAVLQVNGHRDVLAPDGVRRHDELAAWLGTRAEEGTVDLRVHDYLSDDDLWGYLASLDVSVLPYRFGTHSGWLEACRDLQTTVVAPSCGYFAQQGPVLSYQHDEDSFDAESLRSAVTRAARERPRLGATIDGRRAQRRRLAAVHDAVYREALEAHG